mgnify:CR=1 FL=1
MVNEYAGLRFFAWVFMLLSYLVILPTSSGLAAHFFKVKFSRSSKLALGLVCIAYATIVTIFNFKAIWLLNIDPSQWILITARYVGSAVIILTGIFLREAEKSSATSKAEIS